MKPKTMRILGIILITFFALLIIYLSYKAGQFNGFMMGVYLIQVKHNSTLCDLFIENNPEIYKDEEGYCVLAEGKYEQKRECRHGNFRIKGNQTWPPLQKFALKTREILYYPVYRC